MPDVTQNLQEWDAPQRWQEQGDEWSVTWGGPEAQWFGAIYPRIHAYLPVPTILEIAPGYGRWTQYLKRYCERLVVVDLSETCIEHCKRRFAAEQKIDYHVNDGRSLSMVADRSVDFAFTFDSLVHAELNVIDGYLQELSRKLSDAGVAFIHHSNAGEYRKPFGMFKTLPYRLRAYMNQLNFDHWRAPSVTAPEVERLACASGLICISQELVNWGSPFLIDCFTTLTRPDSRWSRANRVIRNYGFMKEAKLICSIAPLYSQRAR